MNFPIMYPRNLDERLIGPRSISWNIVEPFDDRAKKNHKQSLETLAKRGGLSPNELLRTLTDQPLFPTADWPSEQDALDAIIEIIELHK